jgi:hypothetical protein
MGLELPALVTIIVLATFATGRITRSVSWKKELVRTVPVLSVSIFSIYFLTKICIVLLVEQYTLRPDLGPLLELLTIVPIVVLTPFCWWLFKKGEVSVAVSEALKLKAQKEEAEKNLAVVASGYKTMVDGYGRIMESHKGDMQKSESLHNDLKRMLTEQKQKFGEIANEVKQALKNGKALTDEEVGKIADRVGEVVRGTTAQREGIDFQLESAQDFELLGFRVVNSEGRDKPDHLLYAGDKLVAVGSPKSLSIKESWTLNTDRAGKIETEVARERNLPLVVNIRNKENGRKWVCVIEPKDVQTDFTKTAPSWLWKPKLTAAEEREMEASHHETAERLRQLLGTDARTPRRHPYK